MLRGRDVQELEELRRQGLSLRAISRLTGYDRKTTGKYLRAPEARPTYGPRSAQPGKLEPFKPYLRERLKAGVWNAQVLLRELRTQGYAGGYTILKEWLHPPREAATAVAVRCFETPPGCQAQVDWGHLGSLEMEGRPAAVERVYLPTGLQPRHDGRGGAGSETGNAAEDARGSVPATGWGAGRDPLRPHETVWLETDERGEVVWHPVFLDFARYWGFRPRLCRPYRAQTKSKVESGVKYLRRNFLCGQGREPGNLQDLNAELRTWIWEVANQRVHGTKHERVSQRWNVEQFHLQPVDKRVAYPYSDDELRKVAREAYVSWRGSRYSVPWSYAGKQV